MTNNGFIFINQTEPKQHDGEARTAIRKQAMKEIGLARRKYGRPARNGKVADKGNAELTTVIAPSEMSLLAYTSTGSSSRSKVGLGQKVLGNIRCSEASPKSFRGGAGGFAECLGPRRDLIPILSPLQPSAKGYELLRLEYGIDVTSLSMLTTFHVGRKSLSHISTNQLLLRTMLSQQQPRSYLTHLPSRYENLPVVHDILECVVARVRQLLSPAPTTWDKKICLLYSKALKSLQDALHASKSRADADLLCAVEVLSLFEVLDPSRIEAWMYHAAGAERLLKQMGPEAYQSDYEKSLFLAQSGPIITEAFLNGKPCFLAEDRWQKVFRNIVEDGVFHDRCSIVISLRQHMASLAGIFPYAVFTASSEGMPNWPLVRELREKVIHYRRNLCDWHKQFDQTVTALPIDDEQHDLLAEITGNYLAVFILANRLLTAFSSSKAKKAFEDQTFDLATQMTELQAISSEARPKTFLLLAQKLRIAKIAIQSHAEWLNSKFTDDPENAEVGLIDSSTFRRWTENLEKLS